MVRDASFGSDGDYPGSGNVGPDGQAQHASAELTNELARLLAAAIARQQTGGNHAQMTNAGLNRLANLVAAPAAQRILTPAYRDGLSALSYAPVRQSLAEPQAAELHADDEPMPIPSTWRQPADTEEDRWYRQPMGAALLGLTAGLMIVVPSVLWVSGWLDTRKGKMDFSSAPVAAVAASATAPDLRAPEVRTVRVQVQELEPAAEAPAPLVTSSVDTRPAADTPQIVEQPSPAAVAARLAEMQASEARARQERLLVSALRRVENGDVPGAREMLTAAEDGTQGSVTFALAETFDPNMLAAWGARGVTADVARAKALYRKALGLGVAHAQIRLEALR